MFDILVYLFENYVHADACPEGEQLARKLTDAGFEEDEIHEALEWLSGLRSPSAALIGAAPGQATTRIFSEVELARIDTPCRGFLAFLENADMLDSASREVIIERAMAVTDSTLTLNRFKVIVLMVLWQQDMEMDSLLLDELLVEDIEDETPVLQ